MKSAGQPSCLQRRSPVVLTSETSPPWGWLRQKRPNVLNSPGTRSSQDLRGGVKAGQKVPQK